jgi:hypothetical protein
MIEEQMTAADDPTAGGPVARRTELDGPTNQLAQIASLFCHWLEEHDEPLAQLAAARQALSLGLRQGIASMTDDDQ